MKRKKDYKVYVCLVVWPVRYLKPQGSCQWDWPESQGDLYHRYTLANDSQVGNLQQNHRQKKVCGEMCMVWAFRETKQVYHEKSFGCTELFKSNAHVKCILPKLLCFNFAKEALFISDWPLTIWWETTHMFDTQFPTHQFFFAGGRQSYLRDNT